VPPPPPIFGFRTPVVLFCTTTTRANQSAIPLAAIDVLPVPLSMDSNVNNRQQHNAASAPAIRAGGLPTATPLTGIFGAATLAPTFSLLSPNCDELCRHHHPDSFIVPNPQHRPHRPAVRMVQTPSPNTIDLPPSVHATIGNFSPTDPSYPAPPTAARHGNSRGSAGGGDGGGGGSSTPLKPRLKVRVASRPHSMYSVDLARVWHVPASTAGAVATLCVHYDDRASAVGPCPRGTACSFVHADIRSAARYTPHTVDAARRGHFKRYAPGARVTVLPPPGPMSASADEIVTSHEVSLSLNADLLALAETPPSPFVAPSECLLRTRALACNADGIVAGGSGDNTPALGPVTMCCHFTMRHSCDRGVRCKYAHVLPAAPLHRHRARAPVHGQNAVSRPLGVGSNWDVESMLETNWTCAATLGETMAVGADAGHAPQPSSPSSSPRSGGGVFRHDPYSAAPRCTAS